MKDKNQLCPSYEGKIGAKLFGVVNKSGFIDYLNSIIEIDENFVHEASKGRPLEKRFRFAGQCVKGGCSQWNTKDNACGLVDKIINVIPDKTSKNLPNCPIRSECRWFAQRRETACFKCNEVIRNLELNFIMS